MMNKKIFSMESALRAVNGDQNAVIWIRIHLGLWIRIQRYKMKEKAEFKQQELIFLMRANL